MLINQTMIYTEQHSAKKPKGIVIITHGIALHALYYRKIAEGLNKGGYSVLLYDVRGHGKSQGDRGDIKTYQTFIDDLHLIVDEVRKDNNLPIYLLGHSMGAVITNVYATQYDDYDGSISLSAPTIPLKLGVLNMLPMWLVGKSKVKTNFKDERLSHFPPSDNVDPYALKYFTFRLAKQVTKKAVSDTLKKVNNIKKPILIMHGTEDKIVSKENAEHLYDLLPIEDKTLKLIQSGYHNLNHDTVTGEVIKEIIHWLDNQIEKSTT
ncbi:alpha/beta fold hydrolase [Acholeplasma hippikon]|uniref:Phospholipase ytpA n=1 Tax=Acholeplasma hippikon TaxID=264636 RepID=A0A449BIZ0_9MOLU|nr:alpha/beta fold hydrolase [Acholeplasma hippikon]VEU82287.1 Phospholipase ytpA [Acholeplasma hippikon]